MYQMVMAAADQCDVCLESPNRLPSMMFVQQLLSTILVVLWTMVYMLQ